MFPGRRRKECGPVIRWCFLPVYQFEGKQHSFSLFLVFIADAFPPNGTVQCRTEEHKQVCLTWPPQATRTLLHSSSTLLSTAHWNHLEFGGFLLNLQKNFGFYFANMEGNLSHAARMAIQFRKIQHLSFSFHIKAMKNRKGENDSSVRPRGSQMVMPDFPEEKAGGVWLIGQAQLSACAVWGRQIDDAGRQLSINCMKEGKWTTWWWCTRSWGLLGNQRWRMWEELCMCHRDMTRGWWDMSIPLCFLQLKLNPCPINTSRHFTQDSIKLKMFTFRFIV